MLLASFSASKGVISTTPTIVTTLPVRRTPNYAPCRWAGL
jgi:hypothetical protein